MASLYIKDSATAERVSRVATRLGTTKTDIVPQAMDALEKKLEPEAPPQGGSLSERLDAWRRTDPLPPATGLKADKAFFDRLRGEPE